MPTLHMGPDVLRFEAQVIDRTVTDRSPGNYVLGVKNEQGEFVPKYAGRSDTDLNSELKRMLGVVNYPYFKFSYASPKAAYDMECSHYHIYKSQLDNPGHPVPAPGSDWTCFLCGQ